jgi:hypothetical protein
VPAPDELGLWDPTMMFFRQAASESESHRSAASRRGAMSDSSTP